MAALKNNRHEKFALSLFKGMSQQDAAIQGGYSVKTARQIGSRLLTKVDILARLQELQDAAASDKVASVIERKERLTEVARHRIETPVTAGHKIQAVAELNKMEHIYEPGGNTRDVHVVFVVGRGYVDKKQIEGEE